MFPNESDCAPIPYPFISPAHFLFDLVYNPAETLFLKNGKAQGASVKNGYEMLVLQAEENWRIWNS
jgi:shikimate dehydrogenase